MFRTIKRALFQNPLEKILKKAEKRKKKSFLLFWNRGLGDIPLGLFAIVKRIREKIEKAEITFLIREDLKEGFLLFKDINVVIAKNWKRGEKSRVDKGILKNFDFVIKNPDPTHWVKWQLGNVVPKLSYLKKYDSLYKKFDLKDKNYVGVQVLSSSSHSKWRDWPKDRWEEFFQKVNRKVIIFGICSKVKFEHKNIIDLRGKTSLLEMLSIIKNLCSHMVLPDGGILSILYFLDIDFPIKVISLFSDKQGVLKQNVKSPNKSLLHIPIITQYRNMKEIEVKTVLKRLNG